jgi:hypothetical protein
MAGLFLAIPCFVEAPPFFRGLLMCIMFIPFADAQAGARTTNDQFPGATVLPMFLVRHTSGRRKRAGNSCWTNLNGADCGTQGSGQPFAERPCAEIARQLAGGGRGH